MIDNIENEPKIVGKDAETRKPNAFSLDDKKKFLADNLCLRKTLKDTLGASGWHRG